MRIVVTSKHLEVTESLRQEAVSKLSKVRRLFDHFIDMEVLLCSDPHRRASERVRCEVVLHAKGRVLTASAKAHDAHAAIDLAQARIVRQVRKLKTRQVERPRQLAAQGVRA